MAFRLVRRTRVVMLMVPACLSPVSWDVPLGRRPLAEPVLSWSCRMNVLAADRGEGISGRRSLLAAHVYQEICQRRHRIAPPHDPSSPVWFLPLLAARFGRRGQRRGTWTSSAPLPVGQVLGRSVGEDATGFAVCVIGAGRAAAACHRSCPLGGCLDCGRQLFAGAVPS